MKNFVKLNGNFDESVSAQMQFHQDLAMSSTGEQESFRQRLLSSASSDPEIYTNLPSSEKLNQQIQKLRNDMLALLFTTSSHKRYIETIFGELKYLTALHDRKEQHEFASETISCGDVKKDDWCDNKLLMSAVKSFPLANTDGMSRQDCKHINNPASSSTPNQPNNQHQQVFDNNETLPLLEITTTKEMQDNVVQKSKVFERPSSDPFTSSINSSEELHPNSANFHIKSANSSLESNSKRLRNKANPQRVFPIVTNNSSKHHTSECSIDSGYQGSSVTSPGERLRRETLANTTPASPIEQLPSIKHTKFKDHLIKFTDPCYTNESLSKTTVRDADPAYFSNMIESTSMKLDAYPSISTTISLNDNVKTYFECSKGELKTIHSATNPASAKFNPDVSQAIISQIDDIQEICIRPVPKQRTVFVPTKSISLEKTFLKNKETNTDFTLIRYESDELVKQPELKNDVNDFNTESINVSSDKLGCRLNSSQGMTRPVPPQRLDIKSNIQPNSDLDSPVQNRVKLGVSAIKQLTPSSENKEGSVFYCSGQMPLSKDIANSRVRKTVNAKQLLRQKYAAAIERSSKAASKNEFAADDTDGSMVRRRSMRMMTEFQIFDLKDDKSTLNTSPDNSGDILKTNDLEIETKNCNLNLELPDTSKSNKYSVSPSAAIVSKNIFQSEFPPGKMSSKSKISSKNACTKNKDSDFKPHYARLPLPPPPPSPPRTPTEDIDSAATKLNSDTSMEKIFESNIVQNSPLKNPLFLAPLIRPKASLPLSQETEVSLAQIHCKPSQNGLKLKPNSKSAFTPVTSCVPDCISHHVQGQSSLEHSFAPQQPKQAQTNHIEPKRRSSLPYALLSNKHRLLNEYIPTNFTYKEKEVQASIEDAIVAEYKRHASCRSVKQKSEPVVDTVISTETSNVTSYEMPESCNSKMRSEKAGESSTFVTTEPLFSELSKNDQLACKENNFQCHASAGRTRTSSAPSTNHQVNLENQPIRFDRSENAAGVIGALRTAGYSHSGELLHNDKASSATTKSTSSNKNLFKDNDVNSAPALERGRPKLLWEHSSHIQACYKARSSTSLHQYETVKRIEAIQDEIAHKSKKKKDVFLKDRQPATRSHKSTIALIRDSLLGKRDKSSRNTNTEGKRNQAVDAVKVRSSSVGDKLKISDGGGFFETRFSKNKKKESKTKKDKSEVKSSRKDKALNKSDTKSHGMSSAVTPSDDAVFFPDPGTAFVGYGNPDAEVMERFLAAAAAAASNTPRSPLQRLRSSFRTPKNKNKILLQESRVRDDIDVSSPGYQPSYLTKNNVHNGQEFTYV